MARSSGCSDAGKRVVPVTGRPAGWCDHIARMWPVDAVVGENGAFYFRLRRPASCTSSYRDVGRRARGATRERLAAIGARILAAVPGCALASDQPYRETDLAIDYCEDVPALPLERGRADRGADARGRAARQGELDPCQRLVRRLRQAGDDAGGCSPSDFGMRPRRASAMASSIVGDSPNDAPMFEFFPRLGRRREHPALRRPASRTRRST